MLNGGISGAHLLTVGGGTVTLSGATINGGATFGNAFVVAAGTTNTLFSSTAIGSTLTLSGPIRGSGTFYVSQGSGSHAFLLSGDNSGMTGTMQVGMYPGGNSSHFYLNSYTAGSANALWIPSGVGLNATNTQATPYQFGALSGSGGLYNITGGTVFISVGGLNSSSTFTGAITDNGLTTVTKVGTGTQILGGANTYAGQTILSSGVLGLGIAETAGTSGPLGKNTNVGAIVFNGGTLQHSAANTYDYSSRFSQDPGQLYSIDNNGQNVTWATALTSSNGSLTKYGAGTLTLSGVNTFNGGTTVNAGTLVMNGTNTASTVTVNSGALLGGVGAIGNLTVNGTNTVITGAGQTIITAYQPGDGVSYNPAIPVSQTLIVNQAAQKITFKAPKMIAYGSAAAILSASSSVTNLPVTIASSDQTVATVTNTGGGILLIPTQTVVCSPSWQHPPRVCRLAIRAAIRRCFPSPARHV